MNLSVQVSSDMIRMGKNLSVGSVRRQPLEVFYLKRFVGWPGWGAYSDWYSEVDKFQALIDLATVREYSLTSISGIS